MVARPEDQARLGQGSGVTDRSALIAGVLAVDPVAPAIEFEGRWENWGGLAARMSAIDRLAARWASARIRASA